MIGGQQPAMEGPGENAAGGVAFRGSRWTTLRLLLKPRKGFSSMVKLGNTTKNVHMTGGIACRQ